MDPKTAYITSLMNYIELEWDLGNFFLTAEMLEYFDCCWENLTCFPNAAGEFVDTFMKAKK